MRRLVSILRNNKIIKAGSWYTFTNFFVKGLAFITIPVFTRILSTEDYGLVSLYNTWVIILSILIGLSLNESIRRAKYDFPEEYDQFSSSITTLTMIIFSAFFVVFVFLKTSVQNILGFSDLLFYMISFQAYFSFINELLITKLRYEYKYKAVSLISIFSSIFGVLLSIYLIMYIFDGTRHIGKILGNGIPIVFTGIFALFYLLKKGRRYFDVKYWKYGLVLSMPLIFHNLSNVANNQFDRVLINHYIGESATGIYSFAYNIGTIVTVIAVSFSQAWLPWFFEKLKNDEVQVIRDRAILYRDSFTFVYVVILMISTELVKLMADSAYWIGLDIVPWIFMAHYFQFLYAFEVNVEFALKRTKLISIGTVLAAMINISLNIILIPIYGYIAAAVATTISYFLLFVFHYILTSKVIKKSIFGIRFHVHSVLYVLISTAFFIIFKDWIYIRLLGILLTCLLFFKKVIKPHLQG
ncbi:lipopolysaccharide biosynthesis protein [Petrocella sp. FN5]|uniref:lipopolysaccharide biosynthesis protein n=1 Tax=Petrocella sp. FN5 TaxID=3032002 RepID=UPI0023DB0B43|nr:oligosaccharide flippase family protein [Petrocella sp. FN5]MDF1616143.1 oligosaccharide flippase family protein [Petrocella sp. FN5]